MDFGQIKTGRPDTITLITDEVIENITKVRLFEGREQANLSEKWYVFNYRYTNLCIQGVIFILLQWSGDKRNL